MTSSLQNMIDSDQECQNTSQEIITLIEDEEIPLFLAVQRDDEETVRSLLAADPSSVYIQNESNESALHLAAQQGNLSIVKILLSHGADINCCSVRGNTPLHAAIWYGKPEIAEFLINNGADTTACTETNLMPLHFAVKKNQKKIVRMLLDRNVEVDVKTIYDFTPLHYAAKNEDPELVKLFLSLGMEVDIPTKNNQTSLHIAAQRGNVEVAKCLVEYKAAINAEKRDGTTPLHLAAERGNVKMVRYLLQHGADVNRQSGEGGTPLHRATFSRNTKVAELLLNKGADVNARAGRDAIPLHLAVQKNCVEMVKLLLEYGADVNQKDVQGQNALCFFADENGEIADVLLDYNVDINSTDKIGKTALFQVYINAGETVGVAKLLVKIMAKVLSLGFKVSSKNMLLVNRKNPGIFFDKCNRELERMKNRILDFDYNITFYDILTKDAKKLSSYAKSKNVIDTFEMGMYKVEFPIYGNMLERRYKVGKERNDTFQAATETFNLLFQFKLPHARENSPNLSDDFVENGFEVPDLIIRKLFGYLSMMDVRTLAELSGRAPEPPEIEGVIVNTQKLYRKIKAPRN